VSLSRCRHLESPQAADSTPRSLELHTRSLRPPPRPSSKGVAVLFGARPSAVRRSYAACDHVSRRTNVIDQRCVRPTSATDTVSYVHPSSFGDRLPVSLRKAPTPSRRRTHRCMARFTTPHTLRAHSHRRRRRALSSRAMDVARVPLTSPSPSLRRPLHVAFCSATRRSRFSSPAKTTVAQSTREGDRASVTQDVFHRSESPRGA